MSVTFQDGPAGGVTLMLKRAPVLLRVVRGRGGAWDALDQLADEPKPTETVFVYRRIGEANAFHISCRPRSASGWYQTASYRAVDPPPSDDVVRSTDKWRAWCESTRLAQRILINAMPALAVEAAPPKFPSGVIQS